MDFCVRPKCIKGCELISRIRHQLNSLMSEYDANVGKILQNTFPACVSFIRASEKIIASPFNKFKFKSQLSDTTFKKIKNFLMF